MRTNGLRTNWIIFLSLLYTGYISVCAIFKRLFHASVNRVWVDKTLYNWAKGVLDLIKVRVVIHNPHQVQPAPGKATILMCNHTSIYDIPLGFMIFPTHSLRMLAKKELSRMPFLGSAMRATEFPFIDRKNRNQAFKDLDAARVLMESGIIMWIAPEGTRSRDGRLKSFKKGAFITAIEAKATIIPVGIRGAYDILPPDSYRITLDKTAEIHIGKPVDASLFTLENKEELVEEVRQIMLQLVGEKQETISPAKPL